MSFLRDLDDTLFLAINSLARHTGWLHAPLVAYAAYGAELFGLLLLVGLVHARSRDTTTLAAAGWAGLATLIAIAVNQPVAALFHATRPYVSYPDALVLVARSTDYSFPSDHAVMAGAAATGLLLVSRRLGIIAASAAALMAFARVYVAAHYPWDVLSGLLLGAAVAGLGWRLLHTPLIILTAWLRQRAGLRRVFAPRQQPNDALGGGPRDGERTIAR